MSKSESHIPHHLGLILDGNRRWARERGLPTLEGHQRGYEILKDITRAALDQGVSVVSAYVFSTENWSRTEKEVKYLMKLASQMIKRDTAELHKENIRIRWLGSRERISPQLRRAFEQAESTTAGNTRGTLCLCFNYGGYQEIAEAARRCVSDGLAPEAVTAQAIAERLYAPDVPPVDMLVRTSGEQRISNFMLWRTAYSELLFLDKYWPDMTKEDIAAIIEEYGQRLRRFGG